MNQMIMDLAVGVTVTTWSGLRGNGRTEERTKNIITSVSMTPWPGERKGTPKYPRELWTRSFKVIA